MMQSSKDFLYANPLGEIETFKFDEAVVDVFPDMVQRSVHGYGTIISAVGLLARRFSQDNSVCYDLGCSLGAAALAMRQHVMAKGCRIMAVDNSEAMLNKFRRNQQQNAAIPVDVVCGDIREIEIKNASVVVLNFTLQFIPAEDRERLLAAIYRGLLLGGILILSEKMAFDDEWQQALQTGIIFLKRPEVAARWKSAKSARRWRMY